MKTAIMPKDPKKAAPFADDSMILVKLIASAISKVIEAFEGCTDLGLFVHRSGSKGPTILVHNSDNHLIEQMLLDKTLVDVNVVNRVKFLGVDLSICSRHNTVYANFPPQVVQTLFFLNSEMSRNFKIIQYRCNRDNIQLCFSQASQSIACMIESRLQYAIFFLGSKGINRAIEIHTRALCALAGKFPRYFGFRNIKDGADEFVSDLFSTLDSKCSQTYLNLCRALGRPSLFQIAFRAASVILKHQKFGRDEQSESRLRSRDSKFQVKLKKYLNDCKIYQVTNDKATTNYVHKKFKDLKTFNQRLNFIMLYTDNFFARHLELKGWEVELDCKICGSHEDSIDHYFKCHITPQSGSNAQNLSAAIKKEANHDGRIRLNLTADNCALLAQQFESRQLVKFRLKKPKEKAKGKRGIQSSDINVPSKRKKK